MKANPASQNTAAHKHNKMHKPENKDNLDSRVKQELDNNSNNRKEIRSNQPKDKE
ncbi:MULTISPECIES: hypothetical protein [Siphonobacter]|uniref:hypothetical protein n=1 Tax=Siphonobacter TaxID=700450 RepID=UPI0013048C4F|nr:MULTISPECIES: hypothetical protein [Siphonobacter]